MHSRTPGDLPFSSHGLGHGEAAFHNKNACSLRDLLLTPTPSHLPADWSLLLVLVSYHCCVPTVHYSSRAHCRNKIQHLCRRSGTDYPHFPFDLSVTGINEPRCLSDLGTIFLASRLSCIPPGRRDELRLPTPPVQDLAKKKERRRNISHLHGTSFPRSQILSSAPRVFWDLSPFAQIATTVPSISQGVPLRQSHMSRYETETSDLQNTVRLTENYRSDFSSLFLLCLI